MIHSYPWYIRDWWLSDTRAVLTLEQRGLFRELLDLMVDLGGKLPLDEKYLQAKCAVTEKEWKRTWIIVREHLESHTDGYTHPKVSEVVEKIDYFRSERATSGRIGGKKSAETRKQKRSIASSCAEAPESSKTQAIRPSSTPASTSTVEVIPPPPCQPEAEAAEPPDSEPHQPALLAEFAASEPPEPAEALGVQVRIVAERVKARHPTIRAAGYGVNAIAKRLLAIARGKPKAQRMAYLEQIDANHAAWCESQQWTDNGGMYAKGLENWLRMDRFDEPPPPWQPRGQPAGKASVGESLLATARAGIAMAAAIEQAEREAKAEKEARIHAIRAAAGR